MTGRFLTYSDDLWTGCNSACANSLCTTDCCAFPPDRKGYFIILQPDELKFAQSVSAATSHIKIINDNFYGGAQAVCTATNKLFCDFGWKPFDCRMHPVFPCVGEDGQFYYKHDPHCSAFMNNQFGWHLANIARLLAKQFIEKPALIKFYHDCLKDEDDLSPPQPFHDLTYFVHKYTHRKSYNLI